MRNEGGKLMKAEWRQRRRVVIPAVLAAAVVLLVVFSVDDWSRDFTASAASITADASDPTLRSRVYDRSAEELVAAVRQAASRIRSWEYVGDTEDGNTTLILFVRAGRIWRFKDDVVIRVDDLGGQRVLTGESRSRIGVGDLGRNPRNLRRLLAELDDVLAGAAPGGRSGVLGR